MPSANSFPKIVRDWEGLLAAVLELLASLPSVEPHRSALEKQLELLKVVKARQDSFAAARQEATQELKALVTQGREMAIRLRGAVRSDLGPKSERLVQFKIAPLRKRTRKTAEDKKPETPAEPPPSDVPATSTPKS